VIDVIGVGSQLDGVSVCCKVGVELVQRCEWHWQIFGEAPYGTSLVLDGSMQFLQTPSQAHSRCLGIQTGQTGWLITRPA